MIEMLLILYIIVAGRSLYYIPKKMKEEDNVNGILVHVIVALTWPILLAILAAVGLLVAIGVLTGELFFKLKGRFFK